MQTKFIYVAFLFLGLGLMSCNQKKVEELEEKNKALMEEQQVRDSLLNDFATSFETFENNLSAIRDKEQMIITPQENERRADSKTRILDDLVVIQDLLASNKEIIADLEKQVDKSEAKAGQFRRMVNGLKSKLSDKDKQIATLETQLEEADYEIEELNQNIASLETSIAELNKKNTNQSAQLTSQKEVLEAQNDQIEGQTEEMNTGFLAVGKSKELREKNIIDKEGAFLGIGGRLVMEDNFKEENFIKINIQSTTSIPLEGKKVEVVSYHPEDSYTLKEVDGKLEGLEITNPEEFWKVSKFLVVVLN